MEVKKDTKINLYIACAYTEDIGLSSCIFSAIVPYGVVFLHVFTSSLFLYVLLAQPSLLDMEFNFAQIIPLVLVMIHVDAITELIAISAQTLQFCLTSSMCGI